MNVFNIGRGRSMVAGVIVSVASVAVPLALGTGNDHAEVDLVDGAAWLPNDAAGNVVRVNGQTGRVDALLDLGEIASEVLVDQDDDTVLVQFGDQVRSIDLANLDWSGFTQSSGGLVVGGDVAYLISPEGVVRQVDPTTLDTLAEVDFEARPGPGVVVGGRLVLPLDDGTVRVVDGGRVVTELAAGDPGDALHVALVGDSIGVLNQSQRTVLELDPATGDAGEPRVADLPRGEILVPRELPAGPLWVTATRSGQLVGIGLPTGRTVTVDVAPPRHDLTPPAAVDGHVYLVDRTDAEIVQVEADGLEVVRREPLRVDDAGRVALVVEGGKVFVNDPSSAVAMVIDGDRYIRVDKYDDEGAATADAPADVSELDRPAAELPSRSPAPVPAGPVVATPEPPPTSPPTGPPAAPVSVTAAAGDASATVSWGPGGGPQPATAYHVTYRGGRTIDVPASRTSVTVGGLSNGDRYVFEVWATNEHGASPRVASNEVVPSADVPGPPGNVRAVDGDASATVTWSSADGRGNGITAYIVTPSPAGAPVRVGGNATRAVVSGLTNGVTYTFTVTAVNDLGTQSQPSAPSNPVTPYGPPGPIASPVVGESDGTVDLSWQPAPSQTPVTYTITASPAAAVAPTTGTSAHVTGLTNGVTYTFTIVPSNDRGPGPGTPVAATPGRQPTVTGVSASLVGDRQVRVAFAVDDGGRPITGCTITSSGGESAACDAGAGSGSVSVRMYATSYTFTVTVTNEFGLGRGTSGQVGTAGKPLVVDAYSQNRWDGALCTWLGHEGTRPYYNEPAHTCTTEAGYIADGTTVRATCWTTGGSIQDDLGNTSNRWVYMGRGYMSTLYFETWASNPQADLPTC